MRKTVFAVSLVLVILWMSVIYGFSSNDAQASTEQSNIVTEFLIRIFNPTFDSLAEDVRDELVATYDGIVRKTAHFCAYALLGALMSACLIFAPFVSPAALPYKPSLAALALCVAFAASDEYHQTFVDGRAGRFTDVLIDGAGAVCGIIFAVTVLLLVEKKIKAKRGA